MKAPLQLLVDRFAARDAQAKRASNALQDAQRHGGPIYAGQLDREEERLMASNYAVLDAAAEVARLAPALIEAAAHEAGAIHHDTYLAFATAARALAVAPAPVKLVGEPCTLTQAVQAVAKASFVSPADDPDAHNVCPGLGPERRCGFPLGSFEIRCPDCQYLSGSEQRRQEREAEDAQPVVRKAGGAP